MDIDKIFLQRRGDRRYNTSYPLSPADWAQYNVRSRLGLDADKPMAFYIHIPFCGQLCRFCEYTRMITPSPEIQRHYLDTLRKDIEAFEKIYPDVELYGFDIGGGTPTALSNDNFRALMSLYKAIAESHPKTADFEPSIEATFQTFNKAKAEAIIDAGIKRISFGIQSSTKSILRPQHRISADIDLMLSRMAMAYEAGINKINADLMYGLPGQSAETIAADLETIKALNPEQVTVYEFRTNMVEAQVCGDTFSQYTQLYDGLTQMGYAGQLGRNTFTKSAEDCGVSSYLRHRMFDGWQYKGFGISAQSMSSHGISYNQGKNHISMDCVLATSYESDCHYALPPEELLAKYIAISGYAGRFSTTVASSILGTDFSEKYKDVIDYLLEQGYITIDGDTIALTTQGVANYGAALSMFWNNTIR